jgi:periplasmic divalent cation tolerance protein
MEGAMETECVMVWTTIAAAANAVELASALVGEGLAACVNVLPEMDSVYRWKGRIEVDRERQVIMKTTADRVPRIRTRLQQLHSYEIPELLVLRIVDGSDAYLRWIRESTAG